MLKKVPQYFKDVVVNELGVNCKIHRQNQCGNVLEMVTAIKLFRGHVMRSQQARS